MNGDGLKRLFFNEGESRLRAGWRILLFMAILMSIAFGLQFLIKITFGGIPEDVTLKGLVGATMVAFAGTIATILGRRFLDKKTLLSFGLKLDGQAVKDWLFGFFLSALMAAGVFFIQLGAGLLEFEGFNPELNTGVFIRDFFLMFVTYCILVAWWEELVFRGYLLQNMMDGMGKLWAVIISCLFYGLVHAINPNAGVLFKYDHRAVRILEALWLSRDVTVVAFYGNARSLEFLSRTGLWLCREWVRDEDDTHPQSCRPRPAHGRRLWPRRKCHYDTHCTAGSGSHALVVTGSAEST